MFGCADCIDDLGAMEPSRRWDYGFFQPDGFGESLGAFLELLGVFHCAFHCGLRAVRIFPEAMSRSASDA
jgi:hypothetical protein